MKTPTAAQVRQQLAAEIIRPSPRVLAGRRNGRLGGLKLQAMFTPEQRSARSSKAGRQVVERYGVQFYSHIVSLRVNHKGWPKGKSKPNPNKGYPRGYSVKRAAAAALAQQQDSVNIIQH